MTFPKADYRDLIPGSRVQPLTGYTLNHLKKLGLVRAGVNLYDKAEVLRIKEIADVSRRYRRSRFGEATTTSSVYDARYAERKRERDREYQRQKQKRNHANIITDQQGAS
jgi:hypothetical protein